VTWIPTGEGWLYLVSVIDLASRHLLGYSMSTRHDATLVLGALQAAVATQGQSQMNNTIFHTDRGAGHRGRCGTPPRPPSRRGLRSRR
jgi:transposase InsO family protein